MIACILTWDGEEFEHKTGTKAIILVICKDVAGGVEMLKRGWFEISQACPDLLRHI